MQPATTDRQPDSRSVTSSLEDNWPVQHEEILDSAACGQRKNQNATTAHYERPWDGPSRTRGLSVRRCRYNRHWTATHVPVSHQPVLRP